MKLGPRQEVFESGDDCIFATHWIYGPTAADRVNIGLHV